MLFGRGRTGRLALIWLAICWAAAVARAQDWHSARDEALQFLSAREDEYAESVGVYTEPNAGGTLFWPSWWLNGPAGLTIDGEHDDAFSGEACLRIAWDGRAGEDGHRWRAIVFHDAPSWQRNGPGHDLSDATTLALRYRVKRLDGVIRFIFGHVEEPAGQTEPVVVDSETNGWQKVLIDLGGRDLSEVHSALQVVLAADDTRPARGTIVDIDGATFDCQPPVLLRLPRSYEVRRGRDFRFTHSSAHTYDAALAALAHLARGTPDDRARASVILRTLHYCLSHDRVLVGQLRNTYSAGPIALTPDGHARLASWWDPARERQVEDYYGVGTTTGNVAWPGIAACEYADTASIEREMAVELARDLVLWVERRHDPDGPLPGFTGGFEGWAPQTAVQYRSTEMNLDVYVLGRRYAALWPADHEEHERGMRLARRALEFVEAMWSEEEGRYLTGTRDDGITPNRDQRPADVNTWAALALGDTGRTRRAMDWVERNCRTRDERSGLWGYDFNTDRDAIWWEGTAHSALAWMVLGETERARRVLEQLANAQSLYSHGGGLPAASEDELTTGFTVKAATEAGLATTPRYYYRLAHTGATAWAALAFAQWNPYWGTPVDTPPPAPETMPDTD